MNSLREMTEERKHNERSRETWRTNWKREKEQSWDTKTSVSREDESTGFIPQLGKKTNLGSVA